MNIWLDDIRVPTLDWQWVKTTDDARLYVRKYYDDIELMSLDHDLGEDETGYDFVLWMAGAGLWPADVIYLHSSNPVGVENMGSVIERYGRYRRGPDGRTFSKS